MSKLSEYINFNYNKRVLIWGLGLQGGGESVVRFFSQFTSQIRITDLKTEAQLKSTLDKIKDLKFNLSLGQHQESDFLWADIVVVNQDIFNRVPNSPYFELIKSNRKQLETQTGLFFKLCPCPIIGITGTRGKTTTTLAISTLLKNAGYTILTGGNIPHSQNLSDLNDNQNNDFAVLELSNFQLHGLALEKLSPHIGILTSISPDHLLSYENPKDYLTDKKVITFYQTSSDYLIINQEISDLSYFTDTKAQILKFDQNTLPHDYVLKLPGIHNRSNLASVYQLGKILNIDEKIIKNTLTNFESVPHRLQTIANHNGITYVNDTTATTPTAAIIALKSFAPGKIVWIAGGNSKGLPQSDLIKTASERVKKYIFLNGNATQTLIKDLTEFDDNFINKNLGVFNNYSKAINLAFNQAEKGDVVLLSPGFTSFAMFANEFERGEIFANQVLQLIKPE